RSNRQTNNASQQLAAVILIYVRRGRDAPPAEKQTGPVIHRTSHFAPHRRHTRDPGGSTRKKKSIQSMKRITESSNSEQSSSLDDANGLAARQRLNCQ
ncbi:hypothetical protein TSAR_007410, partial [Trichomalopsis sarcophagae]